MYFPFLDYICIANINHTIISTHRNMLINILFLVFAFTEIKNNCIRYMDLYELNILLNYIWILLHKVWNIVEVIINLKYILWDFLTNF